MERLVPNIVILRGPSAVGKDHLRKEVMKRDPSIGYSVSYTTRTPRKDELTDGSYVFLDRKSFEDMIDNDEFFEWTERSGNYYGTPKSIIHKAIENNERLLMITDTYGIDFLNEAEVPFSVMNIIETNESVVWNRLLDRVNRGDSTIDDIRKRWEEYLDFMNNLIAYDLRIETTDMEKAVDMLLKFFDANDERYINELNISSCIEKPIREHQSAH